MWIVTVASHAAWWWKALLNTSLVPLCTCQETIEGRPKSRTLFLDSSQLRLQLRREVLQYSAQSLYNICIQTKN